MIKPRYVILLIGLLIVFIMQANANTDSTKILASIKMTSDKQIVIIDLFDNPTSQSLLNQLSISYELSDFAKTERYPISPQN